MSLSGIATAGRPSACPAAIPKRGSGAEAMLIELSAAQVGQVVRAASAAGCMSVLLSGLADLRGTIAARPEQLQERRLSRSLLAGLVMLASFPANGSFVRVIELARQLDMNPSTTHRYLSTLLAVGLVERDPVTRHYRLAQ
jgi:DNA-binding transcriptional ArsR family regulator